jgi:hypothetical protein
MSAIKAGQAYVEIATRQGTFDKGMAAVQASMARLKAVTTTMGTGIGKGFASAQGALSSFSKSILSIPAAIAGSVAVTGLVALAKGFADAGSAIDDMSQRTGMAAESVSALGYVAQMTGTDVGTVEKAVRKMQVGLADAAAGVPGAAEKFEALGLSISDLQRMSPEQQFIAIADKLSNIEDPALKSAAAMEYFGKAGADLVPMISEGGAGIEALMQDAQRLGQVMSGEDAAAAAKLGDVFDQLWAVLGALQNRIGAALAPMLISLGETIVETISTVSTWISENEELIVTIAQWAAIGAGVVAGLMAIGGAAAALGVAISGVVAIGSAVAAVFTAIGSAFVFIVSPAGLILAAITDAAAAALYFSGVGGEMVTFLSTKFEELKGIALPVFEAIQTALSSGQWQAAGQIAMGGLELVFRVATREIYAAWLGMSNKVLNAWTQLSADMSKGSISFVAMLINTMAGIPTGIQNGFATVFTWLTGTWDQTVNFIAKKLLYLYSMFDRSVDYEKAAKQMDSEANKRADERQKSLDAANNKRNEELMRANQGRQKIADGMNQEIQQNANNTMQGREDVAQAKVASFDARIGDLRNEIAEQTAAIKETAQQQEAEKAKKDAASKYAKEDPPEKPQIPTMEDVKGTTATRAGGTFSGFAAGMMGSSTSALDRMAETTQKSNELLAQIARNTSESSKAPAYGT